ncbi:MAG: hypothetical protein LBU50_06015 [Cellulomonas sp.]|jgi:hypothetical protein|nr:hypothetical protein [Cellulomonas sp.]
MLIRSAATGTLLAVFLLVFTAVRGRLDLKTAVLAVVIGLMCGTIDSVLSYRRDPARPGKTLPRQPKGRGLQVVKAAGNGALLAAMVVVMFALTSDLDGETVVFCLVFGALSGTLDYFRTRKQSREADQPHEDTADG